jgi:hypothetical protein
MFIVYGASNSQAPSERHVRRPNSFNGLKNVTLVVGNIMAVQEFQILLLKRAAAMTILLVADAIDYVA